MEKYKLLDNSEEFLRNIREQDKLNTLLKYSDENASLCLKKVDETRFKLIIETNASYHYCTNGCKGKCRCKDKDWGHDCWGGSLITHEDINVLTNMYTFLKKHIDDIATLNREELYYWFISNDIPFLLEYYSELYEEVESYFNTKKDIFTDDFYELFKENFMNKYKDSEDETIIWQISCLSSKNNFKNSTLMDKYETYQNYKYMDEDNVNENNIFNDNLNEKFSKFFYIYYIYESASFNLESTLS